MKGPGHRLKDIVPADTVLMMMMIRHACLNGAAYLQITGKAHTDDDDISMLPDHNISDRCCMPGLMLTLTALLLDAASALTGTSTPIVSPSDEATSSTHLSLPLENNKGLLSDLGSLDSFEDVMVSV